MQQASAASTIRFFTGSPRGNENDGEQRRDCREAPKDLHGSKAVPPEHLDPGDHDRGTADHHAVALKSCEKSSRIK